MLATVVVVSFVAMVVPAMAVILVVRSMRLFGAMIAMTGIVVRAMTAVFLLMVAAGTFVMVIACLNTRSRKGEGQGGGDGENAFHNA